ncbi:MAG: cupredoxin family copper-binding protein [Inquilinus limosus]|uniref:Cupredoxin family copper-binding protein n=1 Tax=Inquilinus limosus TaxID=171674 RepID=A0A952FRS2_9PROT|nr:cupredoxin family copper-binding protein [Inquilinus limosus]
MSFLFPRRAAAGVALALLVGLGAAQAAPQPVTIKIDNFTFNPAEITVPAGTTVTWTNGDDIPHTVVATDKSFRSKALDTGDSFTTTLAKPGTFQYFCSLHPHMTGRITVTP